MTTDRLLFCLAHAGGAASRYLQWSRRLLDVTVVPLELDGHGGRIEQPPHTRFADAVDQLVGQALEVLGQGRATYGVYGHSMGALLGLAIERELERRGHRATALVLSGRGTPQYRNVLGTPVAHLTDDELIGRLRAYGGLPDAAVADEAMHSLFLPILRADFALLEDGNAADPGAPVACPIHVLNGRDDPTCERSEAAAAAWTLATTAFATFHTFDGGHFFVDANLLSVLGIIGDALFETYEKVPQ